MLFRLVLLGACALSCLQSTGIAGDKLETIPKVPEAGKEFQVLLLRDFAEQSIAAKASVAKYEWAIIVKAGNDDVTPAAAGLTLPLPNAPVLKINAARKETIYFFKLTKTVGDVKEEFGVLAVDFGREGAEARLPIVLSARPREALQLAPPPAPLPILPPSNSFGDDPDSVPALAASVPSSVRETPPAFPAAPEVSAPATSPRNLTFISQAGGTSVAGITIPQEFDLSNAGLAKAREEIVTIIEKNKSGADPVLAPDSYFIDAFNKPRKVGAFTRTLRKTDNKVVVCNEISKVMFQFAAAKDSETIDDFVKDWTQVEHQLLAALAKSNSDGESVFSPDELFVWRMFLEEWRTAVGNQNPQFKVALKQAAYEIAKVGFNLQTNQERIATSSDQASTASASRGNASGSGSSSGSAFHERRMNHIYHKNERRTGRIERIRARR